MELKEIFGAFLFVGLLAIFGSHFSDQPELVPVSGVLSSQPKFIKAGSHSRIEFYIKEKPRILFSIRYVLSEMTKSNFRDFLNDVKIGDSILMHVTPYASDFGGEIYGIQVNDRVFFSLLEYEEMRKFEYNLSIVCAVVGFLGLILTFFVKSESGSCLLEFLFVLFCLVMIFYMMYR